jgi:hypothetical protein
VDLCTLLNRVYSTATPLWDLAVHQQLFFTLLSCMSAYASIQLAYTVASIVCVGLTVHDAWDWPPLFHPFTSHADRPLAREYIRNIWSRQWHQILRRPFSLPAQYVARSLHLRKGSLLSGAVQLLTAFGVSAAVHVCGALAVGPGIHLWWCACFFLLQPFGILAQEITISALKRAGVEGHGMFSCPLF